MKKVKILICLMVGLSCLPNSKAALVITGQAFDTASVALENGSALSSGVVAMGYFTVTPTRATFTGYTSASQFTTNFVSMASNPTGLDIGGGLIYSSLFSTTLDVPTGVSTYQGRQVYLMVGNGSLLSNSTQIGVFTKSSWIVPSNPTGPTPDPVSFELSTVLPGEILYGSFTAGNGAYSGDGVVDSFNLQTVVPEPSTASLMLLGSVGLVALRRLRKV